MPSKKREVQTFATRLNPELVRKLDVYAAQIFLSRNQVIEKMLTEYWAMRHELQFYRQAHKDQRPDLQYDNHEVAQEEAELSDYQKLRLSEQLADPKFFEKASRAAESDLAPKKKGKKS